MDYRWQNSPMTESWRVVPVPEIPPQIQPSLDPCLTCLSTDVSSQPVNQIQHSQSLTNIETKPTNVGDSWSNPNLPHHTTILHPLNLSVILNIFSRISSLCFSNSEIPLLHCVCLCYMNEDIIIIVRKMSNFFYFIQMQEHFTEILVRLLSAVPDH